MSASYMHISVGHSPCKFWSTSFHLSHFKYLDSGRDNPCYNDRQMPFQMWHFYSSWIKN